MNAIRIATIAMVLLTGNWAWTAPQSRVSAAYRFSSNVDRARQFGYDDGLSDGANDRRSGYSFRPDHYDSYKNADRGCPSRIGNKDDYRQTYRQGYQQGYRRGYYER